MSDKPYKARVSVGSRTSAGTVFVGADSNAREYAADLVRQLAEARGSEAGRKSLHEIADNMLEGRTARAWLGPDGLEVAIEEVL